MNDFKTTKQDLSVKQPAAKNLMEVINQSIERNKTLKEY